MRVISGASRGKRLAAFKGQQVRPTPDRVREALFSILQSRLGRFAGFRVLDLFAGSGALAIEAMSRGAATACLVEQSAAAVKMIHENLANCGMTEVTRVIPGDAFVVMKDFPPHSFDLIFLDPPYGKELAGVAIAETNRLDLLDRDGLLCVETGREENLPEKIGDLQIFDRRRYGSVMIHFYSHCGEGLK